MFVVYVKSPDYKTWNYFRTVNYSSEVLYEFLDLLDQFDHDHDQYPLLMSLMMYKKYIGKNVRIYYVDDDYNDWS